MSDLFGNHIVGFPTRRLKCGGHLCMNIAVDRDIKQEMKQTEQINL